MSILCNVMFLYVFALFANFISSKILRNALLLDVEAEFQREPWVTVDIKKSSNEKGSYNFKCNFHVWRNTKGATVDFHKWPLAPLKLPDNTLYNMSITDDWCSFIAEDYFNLFKAGNFSRACIKGENLMQKGNYTFEYNINQAKLFYEKDIGTSIYYLYIEHGGGPIFIIKMLVDTNIITVREYEEEQEPIHSFQYFQK